MSRSTYCLRSKHHSIWRQLAQRERDPHLRTKDYQLSSIAENLYQQAQRCTRKDKAQALYVSLNAFILPHANKPWTQFYRAISLFHARGVTTEEREATDRLQSFKLLVQSFDYDSRAAIEIGNIFKARINHWRVYAEVIGAEKLKQIRICLSALFHDGNLSAVIPLAFFYETGIGASKAAIVGEKETARAEQCLAIAVKKGYQPALSEYIFLTAKYIGESEKEMLAYRDKLLSMSESNEIIREIYSEFASYLANTNFVALREANFIAARLRGDISAWTKHGLKKIALAANNADVAVKIRHLNSALEAFEWGFNQGDESASINYFNTQVTLNILLGKPQTNLLKLMQERFRHGNSHVASILATYYLTHSSTEAACLADPEKVWWLQLAVQNGCYASRTKLNSIAWQTFPYVGCALAWIHKTGVFEKDIFRSSSMEYIDWLGANASGSLDTYLRKGMDLNLIDQADLEGLGFNIRPRSPRM